MKLHNAMWPGLVGKVPGTDHPPIALERLLDLTAAAEVNGRKFDGVDLFLFHPHTDPDASDDDIKAMADKIAERGFSVGSLVAPIWPGTVGGRAFGLDEERKKFTIAVEKACRIAEILNQHGVRKYGIIRIDSAGSVADWSTAPAKNTTRIAETFREAGKIAEQYGERLAAEGEICWGGMHSYKIMLDTLEATGMPGVVGFQADLAHTYLYLMGCNVPEAAMLNDGYSDSQFWLAYETMTDTLRPWTIDFHVSQSDGTIHGNGAHGKTGRHCMADDPNGKLDIARCATYWLKGADLRGIKHICWDGCLFPNETLEDRETWQNVLEAMIKVDDAI